MRASGADQVRALPSPWSGVYATQMTSMRSYARHWHDTFGMGLLREGGQRSASGRGMVEAVAGNVITVNPGEVHDGQPLGGVARRWDMLYLEPDWLYQWMAQEDGRTPAGLEWHWPVLEDVPLATALHRLLVLLAPFGGSGSSAPSCQADPLACDEQLACVLHRMLCRQGAIRPAFGGQVSGRLQRVRERLEDLSLPAPALAELAADAGLSRFQLLRQFARVHGMPPHQWLLQTRTHRARRLIREGLPLALAAAESGFADQSHMTRAFVRFLGFTPGQWRAAAAG